MADSVDSPIPYESDDIRASDTDRDAVAARLREALAEGRLSPDEHSERLDSVYRAKTMGELVPITGDLPDTGRAPSAAAGAPSPRPLYGAERIVGGQASGHASLTLMGGAERSGNWTVPGSYHALAVMGGIMIDLREARFVQREVTIFAHALMGGVGIIVPDDIEVRVHGVGIMGGFGSGGDASPSVTDPNAPLVHIKGIACMGGVGVERKPRKHQKNRAGKEVESGD